MVIWHLYTLQIDHHDKSSNHLSPYEVITILSTAFLMLFITSSWLIYSVTRSFYVLIPFISFAQPSPFPLWLPLVSPLSISDFIYMVPLSFFLMSLANTLSIFLSFQRISFVWSFLMCLSLYFIYFLSDLYHILPSTIYSVAQLWPTLCDAMNCSLQGSSVHGTFQARILEWIAISLAKGSSRPRSWTRVSCILHW